jgi:hypothetical protein
MIPGILVPTGNLGAMTAHQVVVQPIAAAAFSAGALVKFDLAATSSTYTDISTLNEPDHKKNPFNVVVAAAAGSTAPVIEHGGIWGIVLESCVAGQRVKVCVAGLCTATVTATTTTNPMTAGVTVLIPGAGVLIPAPATAAAASGPGLGLTFTTQATTATVSATVLFNGFAFAVGGA